MPTIITRVKRKGQVLHRAVFDLTEDFGEALKSIKFDLEHYAAMMPIDAYRCAYRCIFVGRSMFAEFDDYRVEVDYEY